MAGNSSLPFLYSTREELESHLSHSFISSCSSWNLIAFGTILSEGILFLHLILTGFPCYPLASIYYIALKLSFQKYQEHPSLLLEIQSS